MSIWINKIKNLLQTFLLKEDNFHLLLENGGRIVLTDNSWQTQNKSS